MASVQLLRVHPTKTEFASLHVIAQLLAILSLVLSYDLSSQVSLVLRLVVPGHSPFAAWAANKVWRLIIIRHP